MTDDLQQRLDRLATELTATSTVPPSAAIRRLGRRRRYGQLALVAVVAVALAGLAAGPGDDLLERNDPATGVAGPVTTAPTLRAPQVAEGRFAAVIQEPPPGFPQRIGGRITGCSGIDMPDRTYRLLVIGEVRYRGKLMVLNVLPWPAAKQPPLQPRNFQTPWVSVSRMRLDGEADGSPDLVAEQPQTRLDLERADGTKGSIVGAYRVVRSVNQGSALTLQPVRDLTGSQLAMAWNCRPKP